MPEGPSLVILKEEVQRFKGKSILSARGNAAIDHSQLTGNKIIDFRTWGKQFFIILNSLTIRIHLLMFGKYSIDEQIRPDKSLRLALQFSNGTIYFYTCAVSILEDFDISGLFDWKADVMSSRWNPAAAKKKLRSQPDTMVCDALLDQEIFSGVGNIIKNEVLYRIHLHPESTLGAIPPGKLTELVKEARQYSFDFLKWKKAFVLKKNWLAHTKKICKRCNLPFVKKYCGKTKRRSFFCENCQTLYTSSRKKLGR